MIKNVECSFDNLETKDITNLKAHNRIFATSIHHSIFHKTNANDKLMSLVATRYPDLLQVADMVDDMAESQTESMENIISIQNVDTNQR